MSKRHAREHGRILSVDEETLGSVLVADAASGATTLTVDDAAEFEDDGTGGWLSVNDQVIEYDTVDDDAGTIHLKTALTAAADDGDPVYVWSKLYDTAATVKTALVMVDGEDENTDPIHATLADAVQDLPEGLRGDAGESCTLVRVSDDEWEVTAVGGRPTSTKGTQFEDRDTFTAQASGDQTFTLSRTPKVGSVHMAYETAWQPHDAFTVDGRTATVPDSLGLFEAGDLFDFRYAYVGGEPRGKPVTIQMIANSHADTLSLVFILPNGTRYDVPGVNTPGAGSVQEFGSFVLDDMTLELTNVTQGWTWTYPNANHFQRTAISGADERGSYNGYRYSLEDTGTEHAGDGDFNDIIMDVKAYS